MYLTANNFGLVLWNIMGKAVSFGHESMAELL